MRTAPAAQTFVYDGRRFLRVERLEADGPDAPFLVPVAIVDRYDVGAILAVGEQTVLLNATDRRTRRPVVVKTLRSDVFHPIPTGPDRDAMLFDAVRRVRHGLQTERRLLVRLRNLGLGSVANPNDYVFDLNPAWLGVLPIELATTEPYLILEHRAGRTLEAMIREECPRGIEERRALTILRPAIDVLAALHEPWRRKSGRTWHCLYLDFKPANLLIDRFDRPTLLDFGGCQVVVDGVPVLEGACTEGYAAPESLDGSRRVLLPCADVYSVGATLRHMLTGTVPRERLRRLGDRGREPGGVRLDLRSLPQSISPALRDLLARCLAPRPSDRIADARALTRAFDAILAR